MKKKKQEKLIEELMDDCVSANECTGLLQKMTVDDSEAVVKGDPSEGKNAVNAQKKPKRGKITP